MLNRRAVAYAAIILTASISAFGQSYTYTFSHLAGPTTGPGYVDATGTAAQFAYPNTVASSPSGSLYVSDTQNNVIRGISSSGAVTTVAGTTGAPCSVTNGYYGAIRLCAPRGMVSNSAGLLFVAQWGVISKVNVSYSMAPFVGNGSGAVVDGDSTTARVQSPGAMTLDSAGNLYFVDSQTVRMATPSGTVTTLAGSPNTTGAVDGVGSAARFNCTTDFGGLAVDSAGNVYVADSENYAIRKITMDGTAPAGTVTTIAGALGVSAYTDSTTATSARFGQLGGLVIDTANNLYVADIGNTRIRRIAALGAGAVDTFAGAWAGFTDAIGTAARFQQPRGMTIDSTGTIYLVDSHAVRKITTPGAAVTTIAGQAALTSTIDATGPDARFNFPRGIVSDSLGNLYVGEARRIRKVTSAGVVTTVAGGTNPFGDGIGTAAGTASIMGMAADAAKTKIYFVDGSTVRSMALSDFSVTTIAGTNGTTGSTDGTSALFKPGCCVAGIALDSAGAIYMADSNNHTIRKIVVSGGVATTSTVAGSAGVAGFVDGPALGGARFNAPAGLAFDTAGNLLVADRGNNAVRSINLTTNTVSTIIGSTSAGNRYGFSDGAGTSGAMLATPMTLATAADGRVYVADNSTLRLLKSDGTVTTVAGAPYAPGVADGTGSAARLDLLHGIAFDDSGNFYATDHSNAVRKATVAACTPPSATITAPGAICTGATNQASVPDLGGNAIYQWSISGGTISGASNGPVVTFSASTAGSVTLAVIVKNATTFCSNSSVVSIPTSTAPTATITLQPSGAVCPGATVTASVPDAGAGATYGWVVDGGTATSGAGTRSITFTADTRTTVSAAVATAGGCAATATATVDVSSAIVFSHRGFTASGGGGVAAVTNPGGCSWTSSSSAGWVAITSGSGTGDGSVTYTVAPNTTSVSRSARLRIGGGEATVYQFGNGSDDGLSYRFSHMAGSVLGAGWVDAPGNSARFMLPLGTVVDGVGSIYISDTFNHVIRKISSGVVTTFAGSPGLTGAADGTGTAARFSHPAGLAIDAANNVYVADRSNHTIRKITPAGVVTTIAGLAAQPGTADGTGSAARFWWPQALVVDRSGGASAGTIYVTDGSDTIRQITPGGAVTTIAGLPFDNREIDATGTAARFNDPVGITLDTGGNLYVVDYLGKTLRRIAPGVVVTTVAGLANTAGTNDGTTGSTTRFRGPSGLAINPSGDLYVSDGLTDIRKIHPPAFTTWTIAGSTSYSGHADGTGSSATFGMTDSANISCDTAGNVYIADSWNHEIRMMTPSYVVSTVAGTAPSTDSGLLYPYATALDSSGNLYVTDLNVIKKVDPAGNISTFAGNWSYGSSDGPAASALFRPIGSLAVSPSGTVYVADSENATIRVVSGGNVSTLAGLAGSRGSSDGTGSSARFSTPHGIALDTAGNLYVADRENHTIRKVTPGGVVTTIAGQAGVPGYLDGSAPNALFNSPAAVAVDGSGNVYVADNDNAVIRKITPGGNVSTFSGRPSPHSPSLAPFGSNWWLRELAPGIIDGAAGEATFTAPYAMVFDGAGNLLVSDYHSLRKVSSTGAVTTIAGTHGWHGNTDGIGGAVRFFATSGIAVDAANKIYVAELQNAAVRIGMPTSGGTNPPTAPSGLTATASWTTTVNISWSAVAGAASYEIDRRSAGTGYLQIGSTVASSFTDTAASPSSSYLYRVRAASPGGLSANSTPDLATTVLFSSDVSTGSVVKAAHLLDLRTAVSAVRALAGLPALTYSEGTAGTLIRASHITQLRDGLDEARRALGLTTDPYTDATLLGQSPRAIHFLELRSRVQ